MVDTVPALQICDLIKTFDTSSSAKPAVDALSLTVMPGELYALLGPNGAGKTTSLRMVTGLLQPDSGQIKVCGINAQMSPVAAKRQIAWVPDEPLIYDKLTPLEYLEFVAGLWGVEAAHATSEAAYLIATLGLEDQANERCQGLSKGMRQKVALAGALIHEPRLIILDEPLTGLDAGAARQVKSVLRARVAAGVAIVMTTHILEVAERMADRIGVIDRGRLIAQGTLDELRAGSGTGTRDGAGDGSLEDIFLNLVACHTDKADKAHESVAA